MWKKSSLFLVACIFNLTNGQDTRFATDCVTPNSKIGFCVEIQDCRRLLKLVEDDTKESFEFIRASRCGPPNEDISRPKVCCGPDTNFIDPVGKSREESLIVAKPVTTESPIVLPGFGGAAVLPSQAPEFTYTPRITTPLPPTNRPVLPQICGDQKIFLANRIFGGTEADVGEFPWLARLIHFNKYNKTKLGCSGFLIHRRFVLTAAHCLVGKDIEHLGKLNGVILGMHNDTKARICQGTECTDPPLPVRTLRPIIHESYDSNNHVHDIALIPLATKINFTDFIRAICLPEYTTGAKILTISGWGRTETDSSSRTKLKVELPIFNRTVCEERYKSLGLTITQNQLCAGGESGQDSCAGDSGGPLMASDSDARWYAEGIVSYGNSCGREGWPGVYTHIPSYYNWIVNNIRTVMRMNRTTTSSG